ncbi:hypothetical protein IV203_016604 [Nitzschia inconspicua]|uniref:Uncharacterized protein n=1 Tax=Nitzschia inconspicua TaxID=303405 RepID=A0A9K3KQ77_9STRA|nr:hypothetical protein IV203_016604 [Nitzschia inconspicua]
MHEILQAARHRPRKAQELKHWVQSVQESDIMKAGGTCNRLYQLLMEGKSPNTIRMDRISMLKCASLRYDLFSEKQCIGLASKANGIGSLTDRNERPISPKEVSDRRMFSGPENKSEDLSEVLQDNLMPLGTIVILQDLEQRPDLNGESGKHMGIGEHGRHNIQLSDGCFALKLEIFFVASRETRQGEPPRKMFPDAIITHHQIRSERQHSINSSSKNSERVESFSKTCGLEETILQLREPSEFVIDVAAGFQKADKSPNEMSGSSYEMCSRSSDCDSSGISWEAKDVSTPISTSTTVCSDVPTNISKPMTEMTRKFSETAPSVNAHVTTPNTVPESLYVSTSTSCLKRNPDDFYGFLVEMDVTTVAEFIDAIDDKHFCSKMICDWVKGFKIESLRVAAVGFCRDSGLNVTIIPWGLGDLRMSRTAAGVAQQNMLRRDAPIGTRFSRSDENENAFQGQSDLIFPVQASFFLHSWN